MYQSIHSDPLIGPSQLPTNQQEMPVDILQMTNDKYKPKSIIINLLVGLWDQ
jgi:hypothetical protein